MKSDQNLVAALQFGIKTLDPAFLRLLNEQYVACNLWEGLVRKNINGLIEPGIAKSWKVSKDGLKYTFYLRENAYWSDGKPVTAYHFEYAWKRALDPKRDSAVVFMMYFLKNAQAYNKNKAKIDDIGVKALDKFTLEVTLESPTPYFLEILNYHTYYPVRPDVVEIDQYSWDKKPNMCISNGPFSLFDWNNNKEIKTIKNPYYWDKNNVKLDSVTFLIERRDERDIWSNYLEGKVDFGYVFPPEIDISKEISTKKNNVISDTALSTYYLCLNSRNKPFDNIKVRQAFELALNRDKIVKMRKKAEKVATGFVPPGIKDIEPGSDFRLKGGDFMDKEFTADNISKAKTLLKEAGYSNIKDFPTVVILARGLETAKYIEDDLEKNLGINVEVDVCKEDLYSQKKDTGEFDIILSDWIADFADPINFLGFLSSEKAFKGIFPSEYYSLVEKATTVADNPLRLNLLHNAEKILMNSYTLIPVLYENDSYYLKPYVKNFVKTNLAEIYFRNVYIEKRTGQ
ncbi:MAG TPA: peptide ABC transporter substrate-binding protein [Clostridia bacterium]